VKRQPLFSVIVPTFGRPVYLAEAVASVLDQSEQDFEIVVVDDASPEPVKEGADPRIRVIHRETNGGPAAARNTGLDAATGRYIVFCDDDDLMAPHRLALAREGLARAPVAICFSRYLDGPPGQQVAHDGHVHDTILNDMAPHVGRTAVERVFALRFDERFDAAEDIEWWLRLSERTRVTTTPRIGYLIRRHGGERSRTGLPARIRSRKLLFEVHPEYFEQHDAALGFAWKRIGLMAATYGDHAEARRAYIHSIGANVEPKTAGHLLRSIRPSRRWLDRAEPAPATPIVDEPQEAGEPPGTQPTEGA
jgi:glycosyltransferase involved in cell wall biosynthesis